MSPAIVTCLRRAEDAAVLGRVQALRPCARLRRPGLGLRAAARRHSSSAAGPCCRTGTPAGGADVMRDVFGAEACSAKTC